MSDLLKRYEAQYGPVASTYLYTLGGDPAAIVAEIERTQAAPEADPLAFLAPLMPTTPEQDAHNAIMGEIQRPIFCRSPALPLWPCVTCSARPAS